MKTLFGVLTIVLSVLLVAFFQQLSAEQGGQAKELFEAKCSTCHSIEKPKAMTKTRESWHDTVIRMKDANGAPVTTEEAKIIIEYLTQNYGK